MSEKSTKRGNARRRLQRYCERMGCEACELKEHNLCIDFRNASDEELAECLKVIVKPQNKLIDDGDEFDLIPPEIMGDKRLSIKTKIVYAEIKAACEKKGFCNKTNASLSRLVSHKADGAFRYVNTLLKYGYIERIPVYSKSGKEVQRKLIIKERENGDSQNIQD